MPSSYLDERERVGLDGAVKSSGEGQQPEADEAV